MIKRPDSLAFFFPPLLVGHMLCANLEEGTVLPQNRIRDRTRRPLGLCQEELHRRLCVCSDGAPNCSAWIGGTFDAPSCVAGCGDAVAGALVWDDTRVRFRAATADVCENQTQGRGWTCSNTLPDAIGVRTEVEWRPTVLDEPPSPLFAAEVCVAHPAPPAAPPAAPSPALAMAQRGSAEDDALVPLVAGGGAFAALTVLGCFVLRRRRR